MGNYHWSDTDSNMVRGGINNMADLAWYWWAAIIGAIVYLIWYFAGA